MPAISLNGEPFNYASVGEGEPFVFQHGWVPTSHSPSALAGSLPVGE